MKAEKYSISFTTGGLFHHESERYINLKANLHYEDFDSFFNKKLEWHEELDKIKPATRNKLRQVLLRMLREADLLTTGNTINAAMLSPRLLSAVSHQNWQDIMVFPAFESEFKNQYP